LPLVRPWRPARKGSELAQSHQVRALNKQVAAST